LKVLLDFDSRLSSLEDGVDDSSLFVDLFDEQDVKRMVKKINSSLVFIFWFLYFFKKQNSALIFKYFGQS
jgi:hypothetical protein